MNNYKPTESEMDIDIKEKQISEEQKVVLRTLAESAARPGCKFLEIGSWCGDSTVILGNVAKKFGGHLFCIDWWKGNVGMNLAEIASKVDVFSHFWNRVCNEGLEDVVIPIRGRSDIVPEILKEHIFDLVFIDADHRYEGVLRDIQLYSPLVSKDKGIFCGHDCEGRISDYDMSFLESGKDVDYYESVHCGVVLAVGSTFKDYSINYAIWSICANGGDWEPTNLVYPGIMDKRQLPPPPIGFSKNFLLQRYGRNIYAVPRSLTYFDVTEEKGLSYPEVIASETREEVEKLIGEEVSYFALPEFLEIYKGYNLVEYKGRIYALNQGMGGVDLTIMEEGTLKEYQDSGKCIIGDTIKEVRRLVDKLASLVPELIEESYKGFNIVLYGDKYYAIAQALGPVDLTVIKEHKLREYQGSYQCVIGDSINEAKHFVDQLDSLQKDISDRDNRIDILQKDISDRDNRIDILQKDISDRDNRTEALQEELVNIKSTTWFHVINKIKKDGETKRM